MTHQEKAKLRTSEWWALYKLKANIRSRTSVVFKRISQDKPSSCENMLGCSFIKLKEVISNQFKQGMTWDNYGKWHIDHIIPLATAKTAGDLIKLCHYTNLQPLWEIENLKKGSRYDTRATS